MKQKIKTWSNRVRVGPLGIKIAVILVFTVCWMFVALARSSARRMAPPEVSSLPGLAKLFSSVM